MIEPTFPKKPNPGSNEALDLGCTCPVLDNGHGQGYFISDCFVISADCPVHGIAENPPKNLESTNDNGNQDA